MPEVVQDIGAAAGFATAVGLAALAALHVAHAREVKRLREWLGRAPERSAGDLGALPERIARVPRSARPRRSRAPRRRIAARHLAVGLAGLLFLGAATYGISRLIGDGGDDPVAARADDDKRSRGKPKPGGARVDPGDVTVSVLNSTPVPGLAAALSDQLTAAGFGRGTIDSFSDQPFAVSVVQYAPGHQAEARAAGRGVGISRLEPVTADTLALAGDATVVVIAGADKAP